MHASPQLVPFNLIGSEPARVNGKEFFNAPKQQSRDRRMVSTLPHNPSSESTCRPAVLAMAVREVRRRKLSAPLARNREIRQRVPSSLRVGTTVPRPQRREESRTKAYLKRGFFIGQDGVSKGVFLKMSKVSQGPGLSIPYGRPRVSWW